MLDRITEDSGVSHILFANSKDGWLFGTRLYSTYDGGVTWEDNSKDHETQELHLVGDKLWALDRKCATSDQCTIRLITSADMGRTWQEAQPQPTIYGPGWASLVVGSERDIWIISDMSNEASAPPPNSRFVVTHDGGKTWQPLPNQPCDTGSTGRLAALRTGQLWLLCGGQPGTGFQAKALYISTDGAESWKIVTRADLNQPDNNTGLPVGGYAAGLVVTSPERAWMPEGRGWLIGTTDGGVTWAGARTSNGGGDSEAFPLVFIDVIHGWFVSYNVVYRTSDGGLSWESTVLH